MSQLMYGLYTNPTSGTQSQIAVSVDANGLLSVATITVPAEKNYTNWVIGDASTAVSLTIGTATTPGVVDCTRFNRDHSTLIVIVTGAGQVDVSARVSRDGVNDWASLGIILPAKNAGTYFLPLLSSGMAYGHFMDYTITEKGIGAVTVKAFIMARGG